MASDTATPSITPTKTKAVFMSRNQGLRLIRCQADSTQNNVGQNQPLTPGLRYEFDKDGYLLIDDKRRKQDKEFFARYGKLYGDEIDERPAEEWLRDHGLFNVERGFVEIERVIPDSGPAMEEITDAVLSNNIERLTEIYAEEEKGDAREDVLRTVSKALEGLEKLQEGNGSS